MRTGEASLLVLIHQYVSTATPRDSSLIVIVRFRLLPHVCICLSFSSDHTLTASSKLTPTDDESNNLSLSSPAGAVPAMTTWTLLLYLTSPATGCIGGETVFYPDEPQGRNREVQKEIVVGLETGMCLLHRHGESCMLVCSSRFSWFVNPVD